VQLGNRLGVQDWIGIRPAFVGWAGVVARSASALISKSMTERTVGSRPPSEGIVTR